MAVLQTFVFLFAILPTVTSQPSCESGVAAPLVFPVRNVTLRDQLVRRGIPFSPGTPSQELAFFPFPGSNGSYIFDSGGMCASDIPPLQCAGSRGGLFDKGTSTSWSLNSNQDTSVFPQENIYPNSGDVFGSDTLQLNSSLSLQGFPLGVNRNGNDFSINAIGVGSNSTFLNRLVAAKLIASRTWSVFWGLTGADTPSQMDGNFVVGGYDAAKTTGANFTGNMAAGLKCRTNLVVTVTAITMNLANGSNPSILGSSSGSALQMCIDPSYALITLPPDTWQNFANFDGNTPLNRSYGINLWGLTYPATNVYQGNLTFTLSSGLSVTIPNHQLVIPDLYVNPNGTTYFSDSTRELMLNPLAPPNNNDFPLLGQTFLSSAYMMINYDTNQFTLWQANATEQQNLVAVAPSSTCKPSNSPQTIVNQTAAASDAPSTQATASPPATAPPPSSTKSLSRGVIAGAACGGLALIVFSLLTWLFIHRARKRKASKESPTFKLVKSEKLHASGYPKGSMIQELPSEFAQELGPAWPHEMGPGMPHELPGGGRGSPYELGSGLPSPKALPALPRR